MPTPKRNFSRDAIDEIAMVLYGVAEATLATLLVKTRSTPTKKHLRYTTTGPIIHKHPGASG